MNDQPFIAGDKVDHITGSIAGRPRRGTVVETHADGRIVRVHWEGESQGGHAHVTDINAVCLVLTMRTIETPYGTVTYGPDSVSVSATQGQLYDWAHRPGNAWPCSDLAKLNSISAEFDTNGLVDLSESDYNPETGEGEIPADELNAWSSDVIGEVLPADHPCYLITVGQFREG